MAKLNLIGQEGSVVVRGVSAADAAEWTPASEESPDTVIFKGFDWEDVNLVAVFRGTTGGAETATVEMLIGIPDPENNGALIWVQDSTDLSGLSHLAYKRVQIDGHFVAFRVSSLTLDSATSLDLMVTGGVARRRGVRQS